MPQSNSDDENHTIDDMMGGLRQSHDTEPKLVTLPEGSRAYKVRKRKRRTDQPARREIGLKKRIKILKIGGAVAIFTLLLLVLGVGILYVNSPGYRDSLVAKLETTSGAEVNIEQFRMNPLAANAQATKLKWPGGNVLDKMEISGVMAKISPLTFFGKKFSGEECVAESGRLFLKAADKSKSALYAERSKGDLSVNFARYAVSSLDINFGDLGGLTKAEASLYTNAATGQAEMRFNGGALQLTGWPSLALERSFIIVRNSKLLIQKMRFRLAGSERQSLGGYIDFSGSVSPLGGIGSQTLPIKIENFPLSDLVGGDLGRFFVGKVDTAENPNCNFLSFDIDSPETARLEMAVTSAMESRVDVSGFKFLQLLAVAFNDQWYGLPTFDDRVTMVVKRTGQNTDVSGIHLEKRGVMVLRGDISNGEGGVIKGKLRIGIPETKVTTCGDKKLVMMFGKVSEGYCWLDLEISGTGAIPEDDFKTIYKDTSSGQISVPSQETLEDSFEDLIEK